ncbi:hypothetical protein Rhopal_001518-T1 [Rhodotorula paludigena]|uniref:Uncharacterized protein n=1 Tax=Rhodotorula paludigena TaxID=86838 RepID=A0AAV5GHK6_9BASI|nr:hypothetical protein Rhopal_001518-T1 [Rhodotorula paludigena]
MSKHVSYRNEDRDESMEDWDDQDDDKVGEEEGDDDDEEPMNSQQLLREVFATFDKTRSKKLADQAAKAERQLKDTLATGSRDINAAIQARRAKIDALVAGVNSDKNPKSAIFPPSAYNQAWEAVRKRDKSLANHIDAVLDLIKAELEQSLSDVKQQRKSSRFPFFAHASPHTPHRTVPARQRKAKRAYKQLSKDSSIVRRRAYELAEKDVEAQEAMYKHLKGLAKA